MILGFTGSRITPTQEQIVTFGEWLIHGNNHRMFEIEEFHHGCCVGSDRAAHDIMKDWLGDTQKIYLHPPDNPELEMSYTDWEYTNCVWSPKKPYLVRNHDIVASSDQLFAFSKSGCNMSTPHSGTWTTIRLAVRKGIPVEVCYPSGKMVKY